MFVPSPWSFQAVDFTWLPLKQVNCVSMFLFGVLLQLLPILIHNLGGCSGSAVIHPTKGRFSLITIGLELGVIRFQSFFLSATFKCFCASFQITFSWSVSSNDLVFPLISLRYCPCTAQYCSCIYHFITINFPFPPFSTFIPELLRR